MHMSVTTTIIMLINVDFMHCPQWLETEFLAHLDEWERSVNGRPALDLMMLTKNGCY